MDAELRDYLDRMFHAAAVNLSDVRKEINTRLTRIETRLTNMDTRLGYLGMQIVTQSGAVNDVQNEQQRTLAVQNQQQIVIDEFTARLNGLAARVKKLEDDRGVA